jgi:hypothetical protein
LVEHYFFTFFAKRSLEKNVVKSLIMLEIQTSKTKEPSTKEVAYIHLLAKIIFIAKVKFEK